MKTTTILRFALPSKGELEDATLDFLAECGLHVHRRHPRHYQARMKGLPELEIMFQRVADIPALVESGNATFGITGSDLLAEHRGWADEDEGDDQSDGDLLQLKGNLGYGECRLVVAVPETWDDVGTCADLGQRSHSYQQQQGRSLQVATKYPLITETFFARHGISPYRVFSPRGALEAAPLTGSADMIVDLTATGTTLRENHLKVLDDGVILTAHACLFANGPLLQANQQALDVAILMLERIDAQAQAHQKSILTAHLPLREREDIQALHAQVAGRITGMQWSASQIAVSESKTVMGVTLSGVVPTRDDSSHDLLQTIALFRSWGALSITLTPLTARFLGESSSVCQVRKRLERRCHE